jgi:HD-GYP domain-containing protein (c-di-GMP phosphodiesterase class II)
MGGRTLPSLNLPVSFNKSISWQQGSGAVRGEVLHGIKVALPRIKNKRRKAKESGDVMGFIPISIEKLQVGIFIKLDHTWTEHPFIKNTFKITSDDDIALIKKHRLFKILYDPDQSAPEALHALEATSPPPFQESSPVQQDSLLEASEEEPLTSQETPEPIEAFNSPHEALYRAKKAYLDGLRQSESITNKLGAADPAGLALADQLVGSMMTLMKGTSPGLALITPLIPAKPEEEVFMDSMNVSALSLLLGKTLRLSQEDTLTLGLGAQLHLLGMQRIPTALRKKKVPLNPQEKRLIEMYPQYGREMLERVPGVPRGVIEIVHQHRENLDGTGFPQGLRANHIRYLPRLLRVVTEYNKLTSQWEARSSLLPTQALSYLYVKMKNQCDFDVIQAFIATVTVYPPGSLVQLSDGTMGVVMKSNEQERMRPLLVLYKEGASQEEDLTLLDLSTHQDLTIEKTIDPKEIDPQIRTLLTPSNLKGYFISPTF